MPNDSMFKSASNAPAIYLTPAMNHSITDYLESPTILIVEDDIVSARILESLLRRDGFQVLHAPSIAKGEALAHTNPVSLILLDLNLPDGNGLDLCRQLVQDPLMEGIPIMFVSSEDDPAVKVQGFEAGAVDYITKPYESREVMARVRTHIRLRQAYDSLSILQADNLQKKVVTKQIKLLRSDENTLDNYGAVVKHIVKTGSDFYDIKHSGEGVTDYVVADIGDTDLGSSLWAAAFKALFSEYANVLHKPEEVCRMIHKSMRRMLPVSTHFTMILARVNRAKNKVTFVKSGHPPALLVHRNTGTVEQILIEKSTYGQQEAACYVHEVKVTEEDRFILFTDGLLMVGESEADVLGRLESAVGKYAKMDMQDFNNTLLELAMKGGQMPADDIVLMSVEV
jgi:phosphoserine phosphatase RsbU/P